jgi:hypothetical protein
MHVVVADAQFCGNVVCIDDGLQLLLHLAHFSP